MVTRLDALSISRSVRIRTGGQVLAVFERACDLVTPRDSALNEVTGNVVALVLAEIGNGPLNVVIEGQPGIFAAVESGTPAWTEGSTLSLGNLEIELDCAAVWEPRPDWEELRRHRARIESHLPLLRDLAQHQAPHDSLLPLLKAESDLTGFGKLVRSDLATQFAGLGSGLTPAGDDFLMGVMLRAWLSHPEPKPFCEQLAKVAAPCTTTLSAALLRAAARGECNTAWHHLLDALAGETENVLAAAVGSVLAHGHTSGADTLTGFLWLNP